MSTALNWMVFTDYKLCIYFRPSLSTPIPGRRMSRSRRSRRCTDRVRCMGPLHRQGILRNRIVSLAVCEMTRLGCSKYPAWNSTSIHTSITH